MAKGKITGPGNTEVLMDLLNQPIQGAGKLIEDTAPIQNKEDPEQEEKIKLTFFINKSTRDLLKAYCERNEMTITAGIRKAIRDMLKNENVM